MDRRELLGWISRGLAAGVSAIIGVPGIRYFLASVQAEPQGESKFARLIRVKDLVPGRPTVVPMVGQKQDAWVSYDQQLIGRVWLVREPNAPAAADLGTQPVRAFSSICPHMGCQVQSQSSGKGFNCPCHRASFGVDGRRLPDPRTGDHSPAPRDLDDLDCHVVKDEATGDLWVEVKYEKFKTGLEHRVSGA